MPSLKEDQVAERVKAILARHPSLAGRVDLSGDDFYAEALRRKYESKVGQFSFQQVVAIREALSRSRRRIFDDALAKYMRILCQLRPKPKALKPKTPKPKAPEPNPQELLLQADIALAALCTLF
jgi:hypothetical protein